MSDNGFSIRLMQSREFYYYQAGMSTQALIGDICAQWGIPLSYTWGQSIIHEKKAFRGKKNVASMIISLLEEVRAQTGERYVIGFMGGALSVRSFGTNSDVYLLDRNASISTSHKMSINNLVTKVKVYGRTADGERGQVEAIVEGDLRFGVLQDIVIRDSNSTLAAAKDEANALIKNRGRPESMIQWSGVDLPFLRKGDSVELKAGDLLGFFYVEGVTHNGTARRMTLTLTRV